VVTLAGHRIEAIDEIYFNDELVPLTGTNNFPDSGSLYDGVALINKKLGVPGDTADADLELATAGLTDGKWTANHTLSGIAYLYVRLTWDAEKFPSGIPNISAVVRGKQVFDPRTSTTAYSANAALCLRDYLTDSTLGMGMSAAEIDDTAFTVAANICDEQVQILPLSPVTNENRYEANGVIVTSASPDENIGKLLSAMGGLIAYTGGRIVPYASAYRIPTVTLDETHFVGPLNVQTRTSARDRVNSVKGVYVSETNNWQVTDFPTISAAEYVTADNNTVFFRDVVLPFTTSPSCAQRLAVLELRRARQEITFTARFRLEAMQVRAGDTVMISNAKLGWSSKVFEVIEWHFASDGNPPQIYVDMTLRETDSEIYSWDVDEEIFVKDSPNTTLPNPFVLSAPTNLTLVADGTTQQIQVDGTALPRIQVSWTAPSEGFIQSGGTVDIEYKEGTSTTYITWNTVPGYQTTDFISSDVKIGLTYDVQIYGKSFFGVSTTYVTASVTVVKDTTPPAVPTALTAIAGTGQIISLDWADNTEPDLGEYGVYRNTTNNSGAAAEIAQTRASRFVDVSLTLNQQYFYWVTAYDRSENQSAKSATASATAVAVVAGQVDPTPPVDPAAPTVASTTTYLSSDGTSLAQIVISVPAFTTRTAVMNVLYRKSGAAGYIVADQRSAGGGTSAIDDLTPSVTYQIAVQAFSAFGVGSNIISGGTQVAPSNTTAPTAPSASYISGENGAPVAQGTIPMYAIGVSVTAPANSDVSQVRVKIVNQNDPNATGPAWYAEGNKSLFSSAIAPSGNTTVFFYDALGNTAGWGFSQVLSRSSVTSSWTAIGSVQDSLALIKRPLGTLAQYNDTDVKTTGIKTGGGASTLQVNVVYETNEVVNITAGGTSTTVPIAIAGKGFSAKPDDGIVVVEDVLYAGFYDSQDAGSTSTTAVVKIFRNDGGTLDSGGLRLSARFTDYT
jgi:hypothetical protein